MKQRKGFVSNSSSSSFIVDTNNPIQLAKDMLDILHQQALDFDEPKKDVKTWFTKYRKALDNLTDKLPEGTDGIVLPSCNYDTYIVLDKDYDRCLVTTCNNTNWDDIVHRMNITENEEALLNKLVNKCKFFDVRSGLVLGYPIYTEKNYICAKCKEKYYEYYLTLKNEKVCGSCFEIMDKSCMVSVIPISEDKMLKIDTKLAAIEKIIGELRKDI